jgi:phage/plasmid-associated DNA primase
MSSLLNLLVKGYLYFKERYQINDKGNYFKDDELSSIERWKLDNNQILQFVEECCVVSNDYEMPSRELYNFYYHTWNINSSKLSERKFLTELKEELNIPNNNKRKNYKGFKVSFIQGIKLHPDYNLEV